MSIFLYVCLSVGLSVCQCSVYLPICLLVHLSVSRFVRLPTYMSVSLSVCGSMCLPVYLSIYLSVSQIVHLSVRNSVYLPFCLSLCLFSYLSARLSICLSILPNIALHTFTQIFTEFFCNHSLQYSR
jgi:hypothetical protein